MTSPADLLALAERVEREEPSRELDAAVLVAFGHHCVNRGSRMGWEYRENGNAPLWRPMPSPSASLDAAVGLVPSGAEWDVDSGCHASVTIPTGRFLAEGDIEAFARGRTPAAALTAAALRALATEMTDGR